MTTPTDEQLAEAKPFTLHTRWLWSGVAGGIGAQPDAPPCMCDRCRQIRRQAWERSAE